MEESHTERRIRHAKRFRDGALERAIKHEDAGLKIMAQFEFDAAEKWDNRIAELEAKS